MMADRVWICKNCKSFKVWGFDIYKNRDDNNGRVIYYWGSAGRGMQHLTKKEVMGRYWDLADNVKSQILDKMSKGYVAVPNHAYFEAIMDFYIKIENMIANAKGG